MPITFVEEHVVDRIQREKKGWGEAAVVSRAGPAPRRGGALPGRQAAGCEEGRQARPRASQAAFPRPDLENCKRSFLNKLVVEDLGCVSVSE